MQTARLIMRHAVVSLAFVALYLLLNRPEVILLSRIGFVAWYPASGLVMALMLGISPWYAILCCFADVLASRLIYGQSVFLISNAGSAMGVCALYGGAAYVLRGPLRINRSLARRRDVVRYVLVSATAAIAAMLVGVTALFADHLIAPGDYKASAVGWFLGDTIGLMGIAPFLLVHVFPHVRRWLTGVRVASEERTTRTRPAPVWAFVEGCGQILAILVVLWVMFGTAAGRYDHFYLCFIPVVWIAVRHGVRRVVTGLLILNFGIVVAMHLYPPTAAQFAKVALLMLVQSSVGLIVGSELSERELLSQDLKERSVYLDSLIQNSPLGIVVLDRQGKVELANSAFEKLLQYDRHELATLDVGSLEVRSIAMESAQPVAQILSGRTFEKTLQQRRKDGQVLDVALQGVPLLLDEEVRGAYLIYQDVSEQIKASEAQRRHAESLDQLVKELEASSRQMTSLNEMGSLLECSSTIKEASAVVASSVKKLFPDAVSGALYVFKSSRNLIEAASRWGEAGISETIFHPEACWSLRRGQPHWSEEPGSEISCQHLCEKPTSRCLCAPMVAQGNTLGVLHLEFKNEIEPRQESMRERLRESRQRLAISAASQIALSLASLQLRESLREQSIRDPLTRLFNRRFLEESLERELELASRKNHSIAVLFLDLDHFKRFNDTFGHDAGDMVLLALADLFRGFFRSTDICCRFGGEEFAIVLPESSAGDAAVRAEALRLEVRSLRLQYKKESLGQLTVSAGVAAYPEHCTNAADLLKAADQGLYESKSSGRDRVTLASRTTVQ